MSTYLKMWEQIRALTKDERNEWLKIIGNPVGIDMDFNGVSVLDVDLAEALKNAH